MRTLAYRAGTASGPFAKEEMDGFRRMLRVDMPEFEFDPDYVAFVTRNNGGQPVDKYFSLRDGWYPLDRILNFAHPNTATGEDLIFNVHQNWNLIEDRLMPGMFPFAALPGGDYLLFDHRASSKPSIVYWYHERSEEFAPATEFVTASFADFISDLRPAPA